MRDDQVVQVKTQVVDAEQPLNENQPEYKDDGASIWALIRYHFVMLLASMYMTMTLCSWEVVLVGNTDG